MLRHETEGMMSAKMIKQYYWPKMQPNSTLNWAKVLEHMVWAQPENPFIRKATICKWN
jgi:hypothetical protein